MSETTLQDRRAASHSRTSKYTALKDAALTFIRVQAHNPNLKLAMDFDSLRALTSPVFTHAFGPSYAIAQNPKLQGGFTIDAFIEHLSFMIPHLDGWDIKVKGVVVDEVGESVVVRAGYGMRVKGAQETVENDVVWWLELEEGRKGSEIGEGSEAGGGWRIRRSTEMVDAVAAGRIRELMVSGKGEGMGRKDSAAVAE